VPERLYVSRSVDETLALGERIGGAALPGDVVALFGGLGAGKTVLVKGIFRGLGGDPDDAASPTFTLLRQYPARLTLHHFDAYRLTGARELLEIGAEEAFYGDGICVIEWAERVLEALPSDRLEVHLEIVGEAQREVRLCATGPRSEALLGRTKRRRQCK
jgi:tRNA threonylcarbamoyladenosine biosynthesis protein TsaE